MCHQTSNRSDIRSFSCTKISLLLLIVSEQLYHGIFLAQRIFLKRQFLGDFRNMSLSCSQSMYRGTLDYVFIL